MATSLADTAALQHVRWEHLPESLRQFLKGVAASPDGAVIEEGGRPIFRVLPYPHPSDGPGPAAWSAADNARRCDLIDKDLDAGLTAAERGALNELESRLDAHAEVVAPLPLEPLRRLHRRLLNREPDATTSK